MRKRQCREMLLHSAVLAGAGKKEKAWGQVMKKPYIGIQKVQKAVTLMHSIIWESAMIMDAV